MKLILAILLVGALFYAYRQQQSISSLQAELETSRAEVAALKKEKEIAESPTVSGSAPAGSKQTTRRAPPGQWMWEPKTDNPLAAPTPSQKHK